MVQDVFNPTLPTIFSIHFHEVFSLHHEFRKPESHSNETCSYIPIQHTPPKHRLTMALYMLHIPPITVLPSGNLT